MKRLLWPLKIFVSVGLLWFLLKDVEFSKIRTIINEANYFYLLGALLLFNIGLFLVASRTRLLIRCLGHDLPLPRLIQSVQIGIFFNNFLPSSIGGDFYRMYDVNKAVKSKTQAAATIVVDRFCGFLALFLLGFVACTLTLQSLRLPPEWVMPVLIGAPIGAIITFILFFPPTTWANWIDRLAHALPGFLGKIASRVVDSIAYFRHQPKTFVRVIIYSIFLQANVTLHFWLIAKALGIDISPVVFFVVNPIAQCIMLLPISVNAIGVRDYIFATLLGYYGISTAESLSITLTAFALLLVQGCIGGIVFALHKGDYGSSTPIAAAEQNQKSK